ncbi:hypothetical protein [Microbacterium lushaniae]|uniref:Uncharacterized protein n=1 Tax=Microbacterium lushaniae TaxID=2614639 RepID=A0A5J6L3L0_9MICO|nr:hypothetical protein [Microbacterium lushaniae]QEW03047.1 hypothetical protein F6J85_07980 [Microbacterium lushaniae]
MTGTDGFTLGELTLHVFGPPDAFAAVYRDVLALLEGTYDDATWELASRDDVSGEPDQRERCRRLAEEAELHAQLGRPRSA